MLIEKLLEQVEVKASLFGFEVWVNGLKVIETHSRREAYEFAFRVKHPERWPTAVEQERTVH